MIKEYNTYLDLPFIDVAIRSVVLWERQKLRVFNSSGVRNLGPNIHGVMGRLLKLCNSYVASLNQMVCFDQMMTLQHRKVW